MRALTLIFFLLAVYALAQGLHAVAIMAACWASFTHLARRAFDRRELAWQRDPRNACLPVDFDNRYALAESECECIWIPTDLADLQATGQLANSNEDPR